MTRPNPKKSVTVPVRLTPEQAEKLDRRRGTLSRSAYMAETAFPESSSSKSRPTRQPREQETFAAGLLTEIGQSDIARSLAEISRLARLGALPLAPETLATIDQALEELRAIHTALLKRLGLRP
jgi:hypothetical protein